MADDMRDLDDLEFEELFRAFDDVVAPTDLKTKALAAIAAEGAVPGMEKTQLRPVMSLPKTENLRAEHMRRPSKRMVRPLHIMVGSALALLIVAIVGTTCWFYPATSVRVVQDDMVVDLDVNVFGACINASAEGEQGEAVLMAEDIRNLPRKEAESRLMRRFERMRKDTDANDQNAGDSATTQTPSNAGGNTDGYGTGQGEQGVNTTEQQTNQSVPTGEGNAQQQTNPQQQNKPPANDGQHQQGQVPPAGNPGQQGQHQQQAQPQPDNQQPQDQPQPNGQPQQNQQQQQQQQPNQQQQQQNQRPQDTQRQDQQRQDQGQNQNQWQQQPADGGHDQSQATQPTDNYGAGGDGSQGIDPSKQQTGGQPTGDKQAQQTPPDSGQGSGPGYEGSTQGGSPDQQRPEAAGGAEPARDMSGGEAPASPSGLEQPGVAGPMSEE